ncbi:MAG: menaquinone biosynthetic enzyme MqnA/MqnD family protein [Vulcanimicrobiaceae bacterium]
MLRSGRIVYTNDLPIYTAFDEGAVRYPGPLVADVPSSLGAMLLDGRLDLGPISAFHWAAHPDELALLSDLCIGARREVWSVVCVSRRPLDELGGAEIAVTTESASGRNLLRVLLERRYGVRARYVPSDDPLGAARDGMPALLIGDRAIDAKLGFPAEHVHDLGLAWHAWTGLDFVFAVWAVRRDVFSMHAAEVAVAHDALLRSARWGQAHLERVVAAAQRTHPRPPGFYAAYYETLNFAFDGPARAGLERFVAELAALGAIPSAPAVIPEELIVAR